MLSNCDFLDSPERFVGVTGFSYNILSALFNDSLPGCFNDTDPPTVNPPQTGKYFVSCSYWFTCLDTE